jgi:uncharacterized protein (DUF1501 family)
MFVKEGTKRVSPRIVLSRRQLLRVGGLGMLGLSLPDLLRMPAAAAPGEANPHAAKSCILIVQYGGASHIDSWDPKPDAIAEMRGPYKPIATSVPGLRVCELMPRLARLANRFCLVRSLTHSSVDHSEAMHFTMTGNSRPDPSHTDDTPYFGSVLARLRPATRPVPSYVFMNSNDEPRHRTGGFLGRAYGPFRTGTDEGYPSEPVYGVTAFDPAEGVSQERLHERSRLLRSLDRLESGVGRSEAAQDFRRLQERAQDLVTAPEARRAFDLEREPGKVRDHYGRHPLGQHLVQARRLIEAGVRLVTVVAWMGTSPHDNKNNLQTWDMHGGLALGSMFGTGTLGLGWALPCLDQAVAALLEDLELRGLLDSTLVVVVGEFGRTPIISANEGYPGREHWPHCFSALLAGAGVRGGNVYGASDRIGAYVKDRPVSADDFGATVFHALGVSPRSRLAANDFSRPRAVSSGRALLELF